MSAGEIVRELRLIAHPEGGWYRELHRSTIRVGTDNGPRSALTTIYYLLERGQTSRWHVVESDEVWHFYRGAPLELLAYEPKTRALTRRVLGNPDAHHAPVDTIPAGVWQAARSLGEYSLMGCTVGPGFEFSDFRLVAALGDHGEHFTGELAPLASLL